MDIEKFKKLKESEDKVEYKKAKTQFNYKNSRRSILGYVTALANEGGGKLILGMTDTYPHEVVGTTYYKESEGQLEENIYRDQKIRVTIQQLFDKNGLRVLVIDVPTRPIGKPLYFEDIPLMRVGGDLVRMSEDMYRKIINETEPDFSSRICEGLTLNDIDQKAFDILIDSYSKKQKNTQILSLPQKQVLRDIDLLKGNKLTYAALILLARKEKIKEYLPQTQINLEFRESETQIEFNKRETFIGPFYLIIDDIWKQIELRNTSVQIQDGPYIFDLPALNEQVIREALHNAFSHRDYYKTGETIIKQYPTKLEVINPGGFPLGVTKENLLTVNSTPRNRLLADILSKTGIVERSGQGIDKIFLNCIAESKGMPDYSKSDDYQVYLIIPAKIQDKAFTLFIRDYQDNTGTDQKLSVFEIVVLEKVRLSEVMLADEREYLRSLENKGLIKKIGKTKGARYVLSKLYYEFTDQKGKYSKLVDLDEEMFLFNIVQHLENFEKAKMKDFIQLFEGRLTPKQVRYRVEKLVSEETLEKDGINYNVGKNFKNKLKFISKAMKLGIEKMKESGEISDE